MGGELTVESEKDKGSTFTFACRCHHVSVEETNNKMKVYHCSQTDNSNNNSFNNNPSSNIGNNNNNNQQSSHSKLILVVEDNTINQKVITRYLQQMGHSFKAVANGREALEILETQS